MRAVVQRVTEAAVSVAGHTVGSLHLDGGSSGLVVLVGVTHGDDADDAAWLADKIWQLRILDGPDGTQASAAQLGAPLLVISQFTLYADTRKGRRPSWNAAAPGSLAEPLVATLVDELRRRGAVVETGRFGADMQVRLVNDGPVTIIVESPQRQ